MDPRSPPPLIVIIPIPPRMAQLTAGRTSGQSRRSRESKVPMRDPSPTPVPTRHGSVSRKQAPFHQRTRQTDCRLSVSTASAANNRVLK